ncbi:MAG: class I SAM-dependent methyltransferase [Bacillota bacterium]
MSLEAIDRTFLPGTEQEVNFVVDEFELCMGSRVLDLGCGAGRHCIELASRGIEVVGVDISQFMLDVAVARAQRSQVLERVSFVRGDLNRIGEIGDSDRGGFDVAICIGESGFGVLGGTHADLSFLNDVAQLLRPGGGLAMTTFNGIRRYRHPSKDDRFNHVDGTLQWECEDPRDKGEVLTEEQRLYVPSEATLMLEVAGFHGVKVFGARPGRFSRQQLEIDDVEMMIIARSSHSRGH